MFSRDNEEGTELDYDIHYLFSFHGLLPLPPFEWLPNPIRMGTSSVYVGGTWWHTSGAKGHQVKYVIGEGLSVIKGIPRGLVSTASAIGETRMSSKNPEQRGLHFRSNRSD